MPQYKNPVTQRVLAHIFETYRREPEFLWAGDKDTAALRHPVTRKWFAALMMNLPAEKLGLTSGRIDVLNLKRNLLSNPVDFVQIFPAYHMNKEHWISVVLNEKTDIDELFFLIDESYFLVGPKKK